MSIESTARHIEIIPAVKCIRNNILSPQNVKLRVAAYARVSTDSDDQINSFEAQRDYYNRTLGEDKTITYVGVYADPGLSGTHMKRRKQFLEMLNDCYDGKIDRIITKSVSRFARNTAECLKVAQELADKGITILFESQGIDTADPTSRLALGIMATLAEEESRTISHNVSWGFQKRFEQGIYVAGGRIYGYNIEKGGKFMLDPSKVAIINSIYQWYLNGNSLCEIKAKLENQGIPSPNGKQKWYTTTIKSILTNEKYRGDLILQKTFKQDVLSTRKVNNGERTKYKITQNHIPIVKPDIFDAVQTEMKQREKSSEDFAKLGKYTNDYAFSSKVECAECGTKFRRHSQWSLDKTKKVPIWVCINHQQHHDKCGMKPIKEECLEIGFINAMNQLTSKKNELMNKLQSNIKSSIEKPQIGTIIDLKTRLKQLQEEILDLNKRAILQGNVKECEQKSEVLLTEINDIQGQLEIVKNKQEDISIIDYRIKEIGKVLRSAYTEFNKEIFRTLIDKVLIKDKHNATFIFKCGIAVNQAI